MATVGASVGAGLAFAAASWHLSGYGFVVAGAPAELQPLLGAVWVAGGISLVLSGLLAVAVTPLFIVRRRALLAIAALTPLSIAVLQIAYLGFLRPTALLLLDGAILILAGQLGLAKQPVPTT